MSDSFDWLRNFPSTQATVLVGLLLATIYILGALTAAIVGRPLNEGTHIFCSTFITALISGNFAIKRFSDRELHEAKARGRASVSTTVIAEPPSTVTVAPATTEAAS